MKKPSPPCTKCKYYYHHPRDGMLCIRKGLRRKKDHTTGEVSLNFTLCQTANNERNTRWLPWVCGPAGRHFTPIEVTVDA